MQRLVLVSAVAVLALLALLATPACEDARTPEAGNKSSAPSAVAIYFTSTDEVPQALSTVPLRDVGAPFSSDGALAVSGPEGSIYYQSWVPNDTANGDNSVGDGVHGGIIKAVKLP